MRRGLQFQALVVCVLTLAACGSAPDGASAGSQASTSTSVAAPPVVSPALLDVGTFATAPRPPLGNAGNPVAGAVVDGQRMADHVIGPWEVDVRIVDPYLDAFYVLDSVSALGKIGPTTVADAAGRNGFIDGFASAREAKDELVLINAVLRFPDPAAATAASAAMGDAAAKQPIKGVTPTVIPIPAHPTAVASTYPFTATGSDRTRATVRSFTPHGPYVLMQFAQSVGGVEEATGLVAKAVDAQGPEIDRFTPADPAAFADVPLDPTGLLAKTLPAVSSSTTTNAVYGARGSAHFQSNPPASVTLFADTGTTAVAMGDTTVYEARDAQAAAAIVDNFTTEVGAEGTQPADPVKALPDSHCLALEQGFYCVAPAGRYAIEARGERLLDAQQKAAAQYVMLTAG